MTDERKLPTGRVGRFARLAAMGVRTGAGLLLDKDGGGAAKQAAEVLGTLRGVAAKVGQMASYVDGVVPEAHREAYESAMSKLRAQAPRSTFEDVRTTIESELGAPLHQLFTEFDEVPMASASIGQVHRARMPDGLEVAVKVQHTGIAAAMESDLANASILEGLTGALGARRFDSKTLLAMLRERFREELDYELEATRIVHFTRVNAHDAAVKIPKLVAERSTRRVLTTELVRGLTFEEACALGEDRRRAYAETLWRFVFRGNLVGGAFNADPHPGNYIFQEGARIAFLDFGCCQVIPEHHLAAARRIHFAALSGDDAAFRTNVSAMVHAKPGRLEALAQEFTRACFQPLFASPFKVTRSYAASLVEQMKSMTLEARKLPDAEFFTMPPQMLFMNRLQFGFYSVLARLDVTVDYAAIERSFLGEIAAREAT